MVPLGAARDARERDADRAAEQTMRRPAPSFEAGFAAALSGVRLHHDGRAASLAASLHAKAFTLGNDVFFGEGQYRPHTHEGQRLIAHELAHVEQQRTGGPRQIQRQEADVELEVPTPEEAERLRKLGIKLPTASAASADPRGFADYIEHRVRGVGFGLTLGGFLVFVTGLDNPIYVPDSFINFGLASAEPSSLSVFPDSTAARNAVPVGPPAPGHSLPFNFFRGTGNVVFPTVFSPATTPRTAAWMWETRRQFAAEAQQIFFGLALSMIGGAILRLALPRLFVIGEGPEAPPPAGGGRPPSTANAGARTAPIKAPTSGPPVEQPPVAVPLPEQLVPVGGAINVGGELETPNITNLNDLSTPVKDPFTIKNLVVGDAADLGVIFKPGSANRIISRRLPATVDFKRFANGAFSVMKSGGSFEINIYGSSDSPWVHEALADFKAAGFNARLAPAVRPGLPGPGTIVGTKP